ncbi:MAG: hypothetical protein WAM23_03290, partial [Candidatus Acidiferrales bacterium]
AVVFQSIRLLSIQFADGITVCSRLIMKNKIHAATAAISRMTRQSVRDITFNPSIAIVTVVAGKC